MAPWMVRSDQQLLRRYLANCSLYLEFGSGGSTVWALRSPNIQHVHTVESATSWIATLSRRHDVASAIRQGRMHFHPVDLGATRLKGAPGGPIDTSHRSQWPSYWRQPVLRTVPFDLIVVDGRFRTACFLHALRTIPDERREVTFLAFHNFNPPHRQYAKYGLVEPFAEFVENSTKWGVFRRREKLDRQKLDEVLSSVAYDYH